MERLHELENHCEPTGYNENFGRDTPVNIGNNLMNTSRSLNLKRFVSKIQLGNGKQASP